MQKLGIVFTNEIDIGALNEEFLIILYNHILESKNSKWDPSVCLS